MIAKVTDKSKATKPRPRPVGAVQLAAILAAGGGIRRGTRLRSAFPEWEWQVFGADGAFVGPLDWRLVGGYEVSDLKGVNR